jgi:hypothetical protein
MKAPHAAKFEGAACGVARFASLAIRQSAAMMMVAPTISERLFSIDHVSKEKTRPGVSRRAHPRFRMHLKTHNAA